MVLIGVVGLYTSLKIEWSFYKDLETIDNDNSVQKSLSKVH